MEPRQKPTPSRSRIAEEQPEERSDQWLIYLGVPTILLAIAAFLIAGAGGPSVSKPKSGRADMASTHRARASQDDPIHALALERVNTHLQLIDAETRIRRQQAEIENYENAPPISEMSNSSGSLLNPASSNYGLNFDREDQAREVYKDIQTQSSSSWPALPDQRLNALLEQRQFLNDLEAKQRRAIIRELTMQAEAAGYDLVVGEDNIAHVRRKRVQTFDPFRAAPPSK